MKYTTREKPNDDEFDKILATGRHCRSLPALVRDLAGAGIRSLRAGILQLGPGPGSDHRGHYGFQCIPASPQAVFRLPCHDRARPRDARGIVDHL